MSHPQADASFPHLPLLGAALLVVFALAAVAVVRLTGVGAMQVPDAAAVTERHLRFEDRADGSIAIIQAPEDRLVQTVAPGAHNFLRGTLRGLARERKRQGAGEETPFVLIGRADGRLTLVDPATGRRVDLESFGPANADVFAQLLVTGPVLR